MKMQLFHDKKMVCEICKINAKRNVKIFIGNVQKTCSMTYIK